MQTSKNNIPAPLISILSVPVHKLSIKLPRTNNTHFQKRNNLGLNGGPNAQVLSRRCYEVGYCPYKYNQKSYFTSILYKQKQEPPWWNLGKNTFVEELQKCVSILHEPKQHAAGYRDFWTSRSIIALVDLLLFSVSQPLHSVSDFVSFKTFTEAHI